MTESLQKGFIYVIFELYNLQVDSNWQKEIINYVTAAHAGYRCYGNTFTDISKVYTDELKNKKESLCVPLGHFVRSLQCQHFATIKLLSTLNATIAAMKKSFRWRILRLCVFLGLINIDSVAGKGAAVYSYCYTK